MKTTSYPISGDFLAIPARRGRQGNLPEGGTWHGGRQGDLPEGGTWHGGRQGDLPEGGTWHGAA